MQKTFILKNIFERFFAFQVHSPLWPKKGRLRSLQGTQLGQGHTVGAGAHGWGGAHS